MVTYEEREDWLVERFERVGAIERGHFVGKSGRHLNTYVVKDMITKDPVLLDELANLLVLQNDRHWSVSVGMVVSPAAGAILLGGMVAHHLGCNFVFTEKDGQGRHSFRPSFSQLLPESKVLIVEDIVTSGGTISEVADLVSSYGANIVDTAALWVRGKEIKFSFPIKSLVKVDLPDWDEKFCPLCAKKELIRTDYGHGKEFLETYGSYPPDWPANKR